MKLLKDVPVNLADEVYEGDHAFLDLGGRRVEFWTMGTAHSPGDQVIVIPDQSVTFTGDLIEERMFPIVPFFPPLIQARDINVKTWQAALEKIAAQPARIIVPRHGNLGGTEIVEQVRDYLETTRHSASTSAGGKAEGAEKTRALVEAVRSGHPTWEHPEFIAPAIEYFSRHDQG